MDSLVGPSTALHIMHTVHTVLWLVCFCTGRIMLLEQWPISLASYGVTWPQSVRTPDVLCARQSGINSSAAVTSIVVTQPLLTSIITSLVPMGVSRETRVGITTFTWYLTSIHSVESPGMVDPQWKIWYWGSKWNLHTVCWDTVGSEWSTTSVYLGITYVFSLVDFRSLLLSPSTDFKIFHFCQKYHLKDILLKSLKKNSCWFKIWMGFVVRLPFGVFFSCMCDGLLGVTYANMLVTTQWPLKRAAHLTSLVWVCVIWRPESLMELSALWLLIRSIRVNLFVGVRMAYIRYGFSHWRSTELGTVIHYFLLNMN